MGFLGGVSGVGVGRGGSSYFLSFLIGGESAFSSTYEFCF